MNTTTLVRWLLLLLVGGSVAVFAWRKVGSAAMTDPTTPPSAATGDAPPADAPAANAIVVTYFTTDVRCDSCRTIERLTRTAIADAFADHLASGRVVFRVVNTDLPEHHHFVDEYALTNKTVIVSRRHEGVEAEWRDRQDVWLLLDEPQEFASYVCEPVREYLAKN